MPREGKFLTLFAIFFSFTIRSLACSRMLAVRMDRIIEIEWSVQNNKAFVPSPKPARKSKAKKARPTTIREHTAEDEIPMDVDQNVELKADRCRAEFGDELTNIGCSAINNAGKRHLQLDSIVEVEETPPKRQKLSAKAVVIESTDGEGDEFVPPAPTKQGKRKLAFGS
jgi:kinesin family protein 22